MRRRPNKNKNPFIALRPVAAGLVLAAVVLWLRRPPALPLPPGLRDNPVYPDLAGRTCLFVPQPPSPGLWQAAYDRLAAEHRLRLTRPEQPEHLGSGLLDAQTLETLRAQGVTRIVLHEAAFADSERQFAGGDSLARLLDDPNLALLHQHEGVWAFDLLPQPRPSPAPSTLASVTVFAVNARHEAEQAEGNFQPTPDASASGEQVATLTQPGHHLSLPIATLLAGGRQVLAHLRGPGSVRLELESDGEVWPYDVALADDWAWQALPLPVRPGEHDLNLHVRHTTGTVQVDCVQLAPASWDPGLAGARVLHAAGMFHTGVTDLEGPQVRLTLPGQTLSGPGLPLPAGDYALRLEFESRAPKDTTLGQLSLPGQPGVAVLVVAGKPAELRWKQSPAAALTLEYEHRSNTEIRLQRILLAPRWEPPPPVFMLRP